MSSRGRRVIWLELTEPLLPPSSPFSSYLSAWGLVPSHTAYCIYNSDSSFPLALPSPYLIPESHHLFISLVQQEVAHPFDVTNLTIQPASHYEWLWLAQVLKSWELIHSSYFYLDDFLSLYPLIVSICCFLRHCLIGATTGVSVYNCRDQSNTGLGFFFPFGLAGSLEKQ